MSQLRQESGTLLDRYVRPLDGRHFLIVGRSNGTTETVLVAPGDIADAAMLHGGGRVYWERRGRYARYVPEAVSR